MGPGPSAQGSRSHAPAPAPEWSPSSPQKRGEAACQWPHSSPNVTCPALWTRVRRGRHAGPEGPAQPPSSRWGGPGVRACAPRLRTPPRGSESLSVTVRRGPLGRILTARRATVRPEAGPGGPSSGARPFCVLREGLDRNECGPHKPAAGLLTGVPGAQTGPLQRTHFSGTHAPPTPGAQSCLHLRGGGRGGGLRGGRSGPGTLGTRACRVLTFPRVGPRESRSRARVAPSGCWEARRRPGRGGEGHRRAAAPRLAPRARRAPGSVRPPRPAQPWPRGRDTATGSLPTHGGPGGGLPSGAPRPRRSPCAPPGKRRALAPSGS